jgi:hypothetical protein
MDILADEVCLQHNIVDYISLVHNLIPCKIRS